MKVIGLRPCKEFPGRWAFSLSLGGFIVNGFRYQADSRSLKMPFFISGGKRVALVRGFGAQINRLRAALDEAIRDDV